jgi:hypothetical protein
VNGHGVSLSRARAQDMKSEVRQLGSVLREIATQVPSDLRVRSMVLD